MYRQDDTAWKFWFFSLILLAGGIAISPPLLWWAALLSVYQVVHYRLESGSNTDFKVQVRSAYLLVLLAGFIPGYGWIHGVQVIVTSATVIFNYCLLARVLSLLPWNRQQPLDVAKLREILLSSPSRTKSWSHSTASKQTSIRKNYIHAP